MTTALDPQLTARLHEFTRSSQPGVWNHLDKHQIINDIRDRLHNPYQIQQGEQPFCGPAAVVFELVRKQPHRYIDICQSLYETGSFYGHTKQITAVGRLCRSYGKLRMAQVDWMLLATLRDSANLIFPIHPKAPAAIRNLTGMTKPWEVSGWVRELLGYPQTKIHPTYLSGEFRALHAAASVIDAGGVAFALINSQGLLGNNSFIGSCFHRIYPSHWVTILGNVSILDSSGYANEPTTQSTKNKHNRVAFDIYSWGRKIHVNTDAATIKDYFWGITIGK